MSDAHEHIQTQVTELRLRAKAYDDHAAVIRRLTDDRAEKVGHLVRNDDPEYRALLAAGVVLELRAADARYDAKQLELVEAELTRIGR